MSLDNPQDDMSEQAHCGGYEPRNAQSGDNAADGSQGNNGGKRISTSDIQLVQNMIERCLQLYLSQKDVIQALYVQAGIERTFTSLVWQKLEEQNPDFFRAYYTLLKVKDQIVIFNHLVDQHNRMTKQRPQHPGGPQGWNGRMMMPPHMGPPMGGPMGAPSMSMMGHPGGYGGPPMHHDAGDLGGLGDGRPYGGLGVAHGSADHLGGVGDLGASPAPSGPGGAAADGGMNRDPSFSGGMLNRDLSGGDLGRQSDEHGMHGMHAQMMHQSNLPRNFSLSDLSLELCKELTDGDGSLALLPGVGDGGGGGGGGGHDKLSLPRNFSLSDMVGLDGGDNLIG